MTIHGEAVLLRYSFLQILCQLQAVQIRHTAALRTDKVSMGFCSPIETLLTVDNPYTLDYPLFLEEQQIAVDSAKAQVWMLRLGCDDGRLTKGNAGSRSEIQRRRLRTQAV